MYSRSYVLIWTLGYCQFIGNCPLTTLEMAFQLKKKYCKLFWESMLAYGTIPSKRLALPCSSMDNNHPELSFHTQNGLTINEN